MMFRQSGPGFLTGLMIACMCADALLAQAVQSDVQSDVQFGARRKLGRIESALINESSGITRSLSHPDYYWTHNDNGPGPGLFLIDRNGKLQARLKVAPAGFRDWEDIASVQLDDRNFLILADVGDNLSQYKTCRIHVFEEPQFELPDAHDPPAELQVDRIATLEFSYPEGARDCEAIAVDGVDKKVILISKRMDPDSKTTLHWLPLLTEATESTSQPVLARPLSSDFQEPMVTGMDISADGNLAVIRSYTSAWIYHRATGQNWIEALAGSPRKSTLLPIQRQGEAVCFSHDGNSVLVTSEGIQQTIWQIDISGVGDDR